MVFLLSTSRLKLFGAYRTYFIPLLLYHCTHITVYSYVTIFLHYSRVRVEAFGWAASTRSMRVLSRRALPYPLNHKPALELETRTKSRPLFPFWGVLGFPII